MKPPEVARLVPAQEAISGAHVPMLDPHTMAEAEVTKVIGDGPRCEVRYTTAGAAALGMAMQPNGDATRGVVKLNGKLIALSPGEAGNAPARPGMVSLVSGPVRLTVAADQQRAWEPLAGVQRREATMMLEVSDALRVGYRGYLDCAPGPIRISHRR